MTTPSPSPQASERPAGASRLDGISFYSEPGVVVHHGDSLSVLPTFAAERFSTIITDPPYGLSFMGREWDHGVPGVPFWIEALRVCKPGATLFAFGGTRTFHRLTTAIEDAGWEIRDCMMWLYGSGMPKGQNIAKSIGNRGENWEGWNTQLKPAWEPIIVAMKPLDGTFARNALAHGVAGMNIDGARIGGGPRPARERDAGRMTGNTFSGGVDGSLCGSRAVDDTTLGRWPANVVLDDVAGAMLDEQTGTLTSGANPTTRGLVKSRNAYGEFAGQEVCDAARGIDSVGASRFFYCAKASASERGSTNDHPTVKPLDVLRYLAKLSATPTGGEVLDLFAGSGGVPIVCRELGRPVVAIEKDAHYCQIIVDRLRERAVAAPEPDLFTQAGAA